MNLLVKFGPAVIELVADRPPHDLDHIFIRPFFLDKTETPSVKIHIHFDPPPESPHEFIAEFNNQWRFYRQGSGKRLEILEQNTFQIKQIILMNESWDQVDLYMTPTTYTMTGGRKAGTWYIGDIFEPFIQWWLTSWLARNSQGLILHSSVVRVQDKTWVFFGPSEAGKTTTARFFLESGYIVLNDERTVIWQDAGQWMAGGTSWHGELRQVRNDPAPLAGLFSLQKAQAYQLLPLPANTVLHRLIPECYLPLWSRETLDGFMTAAERLVEAVPSHELHFLKDRGVVDFLISSLHADRVLEPV